MSSPPIYQQEAESSSLVTGKKASETQKQSETTSSLNWLKSFIAGGMAGCVAKTSVAPLERTKILMQVSTL